MQELSSSAVHVDAHTFELMHAKSASRLFRERTLLSIQQGAPEFASMISRMTYRGGKRVNLIRKREDSVFERLFIEFYSDTDRQMVGLQLATSYFPECPIPSGPFGYDALLEDIVMARDKGHTDFRKYWSGAGWYKVKLSDEDAETFFQIFKKALREDVRPVLEDWSCKLLADDLLRIAVGSYWEIEREKKSLEEAETIFSRRLDKIGPTSVEGYSIPKIKLQLLTRLRGLKVWHQV